jgi:hypothetical protein
MQPTERLSNGDLDAISGHRSRESPTPGVRTVFTLIPHEGYRETEQRAGEHTFRYERIHFHERLCVALTIASKMTIAGPTPS